MVRTLELSCDPKQTDAVVAHLQRRGGVLGVTVQKGASVQPPGDVVTVHAEHDEAHGILDWLGTSGAASSIVMSRPTAAVASRRDPAADHQGIDGSYEETMQLLRRETNVSQEFLALMLLSGVIAAVGLWTDTLHLVIGAMVIAPGFQPLLRLPLGLVTRHRPMMWSGLRSAGAGYGALLVGAAVCVLVLRASDVPGGTSGQWAAYWSSTTATSWILAVAAGAAGVFSIMSQRSVLSAGAMIALALVPSSTLVAMGSLAGEMEIAGGAFQRWLVDVGTVLVVATLLFGAKRLLVHRRAALTIA